MKNIAKKIELVSNVAIIVVALLLCAIFTKQFLLLRSVRSTNSAALHSTLDVGTKVNLQGVDWSKDGKTLIMALSNSCHFCTESAPLYQRLAQRRGDTRLVAVLPQPVEEGKTYLESLNVKVDDVRQLPLDSLGIMSTPTLILVDSKGVTVNSWVGKLATSREQELLESLQ
jgi:thioredoxin-related protein